MYRQYIWNNRQFSLVVERANKELIRRGERLTLLYLLSFEIQEAIGIPSIVKMGYQSVIVSIGKYFQSWDRYLVKISSA